jgi:hypothetical protein
MELNKKITFADTIFAQEVDGEMVLLDMESENYFGLDSVGSSIWSAIEKCDGRLQDVYESLLKEYDVEPEVLQKDLDNFIKQLQDNGLVEVNII